MVTSLPVSDKKPGFSVFNCLATSVGLPLKMTAVDSALVWFGRLPVNCVMAGFLAFGKGLAGNTRCHVGLLTLLE